MKIHPRHPRLPGRLTAFLLLCLSSAASLADEPLPAGGTLDFAIVRKGDVIGNYRSDFSPKPDGSLEVITSIGAEVTLGPIRLYHFTHTSTETWRDERLISLFSDTDDDGEVHHLQAHEDGGALTLTVDGKTVTPPADSVPSSLWRLSMVESGRPIFDITDGQQFKAQSHCAPSPGPALATGQNAPPPLTNQGPGSLCQITGDLERTLHYTPQGLLDGLAFTADDGSTVTYRPR